MVYCYDMIESSDARKKENIREISNALNIVLQLKAVKYDTKKDFLYDETKVSKSEKDKFEIERKDKIGFLAQDVEKVIPEVVAYDDSSDTYGITYSRFVPILAEAIKEQQTIINDLIARIEKLEGNASKEKSATIENSSSDETQSATLNQNVPNPFTANTTINMYLPGTITRAVLYIYNMQGLQIKNYVIQERGNTSVDIEGYALDAGMYLYSLVADGKEVDTKKMILTK